MSASDVGACSGSGKEACESAEEEDGEGVSLSAILDDDTNLPSEPSDSESPDEGEDDVLAFSDNELGSSQAADALEKLDRFIDELHPAQKRKAPELEGGGNVSRKRKRNNLKEHNEAGTESEFATRGSLEGEHQFIRY
jgi:hypothetical protein